MIGDIFKIALDDAFHMGYHRAFNAIMERLYIRRLAHHLKQYITSCPKCQLNRTIQHALYGSMMSIRSPLLPFHTICMDFIVALLPSEIHQFNSILTVINKSSKKKLLIPGWENMSAKLWAIQLFDYLRLCNWSVLSVTISNRNPKFWFKMWKKLFKLLKMDLLISTAYYPQTNKLSERTN